MSADVFLWDEAKNPADIVLRTSAAETAPSPPAGGGTVRRSAPRSVPRVVDDRIPPDIYRETKHRLTLTVRREWWVTVTTSVRLHTSGESAAVASTTARHNLHVDATSTARAETSQRHQVTVKRAHSAPDVFDLLDLL